MNTEEQAPMNTSTKIAQTDRAASFLIKCPKGEYLRFELDGSIDAGGAYFARGLASYPDPFDLGWGPVLGRVGAAWRFATAAEARAWLAKERAGGAFWRACRVVRRTPRLASGPRTLRASRPLEIFVVA
jgi:hypothetical protein